MMKTYLLLFICSISYLASAQIQWELIEGPYRAEVHSFLLTNNSHLLAGTIPFEVFRSSDGGLTWDTSGTGLPELPYEIKVLEKDSENGVYCGARSGVYYSSDDGYNWDFRGYGYHNYALAINSDGHVYSGGSHQGIYKTTDKGLNWIRIDDGSLFSAIFALQIISDSILIGGTPQGIFYSYNYGITWSQSSGIISSTWITSLIKSNENIYAGTSMHGAFISTDNGISWHQRTNGIEDYPITSMTASDDGTVYAGTSYGGMFKTTNGGMNWLPINEGIQIKNVTTVYYNGTGAIYCSTLSGGTYKSTNAGENWIDLYPKFQLSDINNIFQDENDYLFISSYSSGVQHSSDYGELWQFRSTNLSSRTIDQYTISSGGLQFAIARSRNGWSLFKSSNYGMEWHLLLPDSLHNLSKVGVGLEGTVFLVHGGMIYRSNDNGESWNRVGNEINVGFAQDFSFPSSNQVFLCSSEGLFYSSNNGDDWMEFPETSGHWVIAIHCIDSTRFFINTDGWNTDTGFHLKYTTDLGSTWSDINIGLPETFLFGNIFSTTAGEIFASVGGFDPDFRIVRALDGEFIWDAIQGDLPTSSIRAMELSKDNHLFVGLGSETGIYRTIEPVTDLDDVENLLPINVRLYNNYPNPFNPVTTISYSLPSSSLVQLKIFNILGQEIATLVNEEKMSGNYKVDFNASNLPSGVYLYKLQAGEFVETKKMVLLK